MDIEQPDWFKTVIIIAPCRFHQWRFSDPVVTDIEVGPQIA